MSRLSSQRNSRSPYEEARNRDAFGDFPNYNDFPSPQPGLQDPIPEKTSIHSEDIRLYVTLRKSQDSVSEYKKLILMVPGI